MRNVVGILVAAAVGIHCSAPGDTFETDEAEVATSAETQPEERRSPSPAEAVDDQPSTPEPLLDLSSFIHDGSAPLVTSTVQDETGATYATGTFVGNMAIGDSVIHSRGDKDVFLVKLTPAGDFAWVRAVGSAAPESAPRVSLEDQRRITIIGMTKGEMDCGSGPLNTWDSSTFFVCIFGGKDGATLNAGAFPTGNL